jgi:hypothetical protein
VAATTEGPSASGIVLLTLAAGQFLMTLDSSVMNVSIATVAKDVGTTVTGIQTAITLYRWDGVADDHRRKARPDPRPQACVRDRMCDLRLWVVHHRDLAEPWRLAVRMVVPRRCGYGADPARDRRAGGVQLFARRAAARVWAGRVGGRDRSGGGAVDWRAVHDVSLVAVGVCGGGSDRVRDSCPDSPDGERDARDGYPTRSRGDGALCARSRADRVRDPAGGRLGVGPAQAGGAGMGWSVAGDLAAARRRGGVVAVHGLGEPSARPRRRTPREPGNPAEPNSARWADLVLLPIPTAGRTVLRSTAVLSVALGLSAIATGVRLLPLSITLLLAAAGSRRCSPTRHPAALSR